MGFVRAVDEIYGDQLQRDSDYVETRMHDVLKVSVRVRLSRRAAQGRPLRRRCQSHQRPDYGHLSGAHPAVEISEPSSQMNGLYTIAWRTSSLTRDQKPLLT